MALSDTKICAAMTILQMFVCASIYSLAVAATYRVRGRRAAYFMLFFFGIFPACSFSAISITKDAIYSALFVLVVVLSFEIMSKRKAPRSEYVCYGIITTLFILFRNNAIYYYIPWLLLAFLILLKHKKHMRMVAINAVSILLSVIINNTLIGATGAYEYQEQAAFSVPLQQMLGTAIMHEKEEVPRKGEGGKMFDFFERDELENKLPYSEINADRAKLSIGKQITKDNKIGFLKAYIGAGAKYPNDYIRIFLRLTLCSWYPLSYDFAYFYGTSFAETSFFSGIVELMPNVRQNSKLPELKKFLDENWRNLGYRDNLIVNLIMAPATYTLSLLVILCYAAYRKRRKILILGLLIFLNYLCILLSPGILLRYMWPIMFSVPLLGVLLYRPRRKISKTLQKSQKSAIISPS